MKDKQASLSAQAVAVQRAIESEKPEALRVCHDPLTRPLIGPKAGLFGTLPIPQRLALWLYKKGWPGFHSYFAARTRHIDEYLSRCITDGIEQVVILGAGYDTRAYRFEALKENHIKVFEVDHPATQHHKRQRLQDIFTQPPDHVTYVAIDFETQVLSRRLGESGYDEGLKTFFIWEGVSYYLQAQAVDKTLAFIRDHSGSGSSLIFDYTHPDVVEGRNPRKEAKTWHKWMIRVGEPLSFGIESGTISSFLEQRGFSVIRNADNEFLKNAYFTGANRQRQISPLFEIVYAGKQMG